MISESSKTHNAYENIRTERSNSTVDDGFAKPNRRWMGQKQRGKAAEN
jgi:hypothetical protein